MGTKITEKIIIKISLISLLISTIITVVVMFLFIPVRVTGGEAGINEIRLMPFNPQFFTSSESESLSSKPSPNGKIIIPDSYSYDLEKGLYVAEGIIVFIISFLVSVWAKVRKAKKKHLIN